MWALKWTAPYADAAADLPALKISSAARRQSRYKHALKCKGLRMWRVQARPKWGCEIGPLTNTQTSQLISTENQQERFSLRVCLCLCDRNKFAVFSLCSTNCLPWSWRSHLQAQCTSRVAGEQPGMKVQTNRSIDVYRSHPLLLCAWRLSFCSRCFLCNMNWSYGFQFLSICLR